MSEISLHNLSKTFPDGTQAVKNISLKIKQGEFLVLVGPSGCGKTTLLRLIAGLENPSGGTIQIGEKDATNLASKDRDLALVFQNYALFPHMNAFDNMAFGLHARKVSKEKIKQKVLPVAQRLGLEKLLQRKPNELSGGQRQRVALGRLLARNPSIHLLDEPLSNLDANLRTSMRYQLTELHQEFQRTTLFVTHDQVEAMTLGDRICVMNEGEVMQLGTPTEIYDQPAHRFVAEFFGSPKINLLDGYISGTKEKYCFQQNEQKIIFSSDQSIPEGPIVLGLRPECLNIQKEKSSDSWKAELQRIENMGDIRVLHFQGQDCKITLKSKRNDFQPGQAYHIKPEWKESIWFNASTGNLISG
jgi:multiple sugar transport system ATP-binding protein